MSARKRIITRLAALYPNYYRSGCRSPVTRNTFAQQARFRLTTDVRTQTEYGTLRSYFASASTALNQPSEDLSSLRWLRSASTATTTSMERAFIQFAGFTIGRADTFFAFYNGAAYGLVPLQYGRLVGSRRSERVRLHLAVR